MRLSKYKRYVAVVESTTRATFLHGRVINSGPYPIATFEATDPSQLRRELHRSIDECFLWCEEDGVELRFPSAAGFSS